MTNSTRKVPPLRSSGQQVSAIGGRIETAIEKAGGLRTLARLLKWSPASLIKVRDGERISPYRAAQLAEYLGLSREDQDDAMYAALAALAKAEAERAYWIGRNHDLQMRRTARRLALEAWAESGSKSLELLEKEERLRYAELVAEANGDVQISLKDRKTA